MKTMGQKRAAFALEKVMAIPPEKKDRFKPFSAGAPSMILQNGFGQALAFWISKGKDEHMAIFHIVKEWLVKNNLASGRSPSEFIGNISQKEQTGYLTAQKEALALLEWVKRYANAGL